MLVRLEFCLLPADWTLQDWKNVIWTDETSVMLGSRCGVWCYLWRWLNEQLILSCICRRWSGYSEFMFWGSFIYNRKGLMYIWKKEIPVEKKQVDADLAA